MSSFLMRLFALFFMMVDHTGLALFPNVGLFRCIGRLAFPMYCFLLVQGFVHTKDVRAYARRLLLLAIVSEIPFDLLIFGRLSSAAEQNVVFSLLLALLSLCVLKSLSKKPWPCVLTLTALCAAAMAARVSYGWLGILLCLGFYAARNSRLLQALCAVFLELLYTGTLLLSGVNISWVLTSLCACLSAVFILLYNGKRGPHHPALSFLFYVAYPLHLLALLAVRMMHIIPPYYLG